MFKKNNVFTQMELSLFRHPTDRYRLFGFIFLRYYGLHDICK